MRKHCLLLRAPLLVGVGVALLPAFAQQPVPPPAAPPQSHRMPVASKFSYACDGNVTVAVTLRGERARVVFKDKTYSMKHVKSGSGARYAEGSVVWWNKGYGGFLQDESDPNHPVMLAENCKQTSPTPNSSDAAHAVSGTVAYRERIAMPENALHLRDTSRADAPARVVAQQEITFGRRQVPLPFELASEPVKIDPQHTYSVSARINVDGHTASSHKAIPPTST